ncbi:MAG: carbonic anhydrase [Planctomycetota bacterium]
MIPASEALERLRGGNRRFVAGKTDVGEGASRDRLAELSQGQSPFAIVLACSDSRVPVEILFDQKLGDLFVVRVAGNVALASQIGSIEFGVGQCGARLVVVLGHSQCGAVRATIDSLREGGADLSPSLARIVDEIRKATTAFTEVEMCAPGDELLEKAVGVNALHSAQRLAEESALIRKHLAAGSLQVLAAEYSIETGAVEFLMAD